MAFADAVQIANGQVASLAANAGNPVKGGAVYNLTPPTATNGQVVDEQCDINGNQKVTVQNGVPSGTAGAPSSAVLSVQGLASMTPVGVQTSQATAGGAPYSNAIAPATPAVTTVKGSAGNIVGILAFNQLATPVFLKFFDVAGSITLGTTSCTYEFMIPGNTGGAGFVIPLQQLRSHANSIKYAVTNLISFTDNTSITANSVLVDVSYN